MLYGIVGCDDFYKLMKAVYIGGLTAGTTSKMRAECLMELRPNWDWSLIDTEIPFSEGNRLLKSAAFRFKVGPVVKNINDYILSRIVGMNVDLIWVDKGIFIYKKTLEIIRKSCARLVHFTPDTSFFENYSLHFLDGINLYDTVVTTKTFEIELYRKYLKEEKIVLVTQGYDKSIHYPRSVPGLKKRDVVFIGLAEPDREHCINLLLRRGVPVRLAGRGWSKFVRSRRSSESLSFEGELIVGEEYAKMVSESWIGLGLVSKRFPELHTTRTFEIPACGTILSTVRNAEVAKFFAEGEVLFATDYNNMADTIEDIFKNSSEDVLVGLAESGRKRVVKDERSYHKILGDII